MMLGHDVSTIPQDEVSDSSQPITPHMKGHISEQRVQINIPVLDVYDEETDDLSNAFVDVFAGTPEQQHMKKRNMMNCVNFFSNV